MSEFKTSLLIISSIALGYLMKILFLYCFFGNKLTDDLLSMNDLVYESEWYHYPVQTQRYLILIMARAQQPFYISAYNVMPCTLENYGKVNE